MSASRGRRGRGGTGKKSRLSEKRGDEVGKVKGGRERTRDCNLINPRLEVEAPRTEPIRSTGSSRSARNLGSIGLRSLRGRKGTRASPISRRLSTCPADRCGRIRTRNAPDEFHARSRTHRVFVAARAPRLH